MPLKPDDVVRGLFEAMARGEVDAAVALVDPAVEWTPTVWSGRSARGRPGVREWMLQFADNLEDLRVRLEAVEPRSFGVLALGTVFNRRVDQAMATASAGSSRPPED
jgi:ketosteroid isomerase-like protein